QHLGKVVGGRTEVGPVRKTTRCMPQRRTIARYGMRREFVFFYACRKRDAALSASVRGVRSAVLLAYNLMRLLTWPIWTLWWRLRRSRAPWIVLRLRGPLDEIPAAPRRLLRLLTGAHGTRRSVAEIRKLCDRIAGDPRAEGLLLRLEQLDAGYATLASLRTELLRLRKRGKQVLCYLPLDATQRELYVASAAGRVLAMPHAGFSALGPLAARTYLAPLLDRLGVQVVVTAEGRYKSAADALVRDSMSGPEREQLEAIVRTLRDNWVTALGERAQLGANGAEALYQEGMFGAGRARELGAIDDCAYDDELASRLSFSKRSPPAAHDRYLRRLTARPATFVALRKRPQVALVRLVGTISERGGSAANPGIDLHGTSALLRSLAAARHICGVILYIDSPGGSAIVSELLHREIEQLGGQKPVVTWMGNVAASGGYYMASATRAIIAQPTTLTGSIGVISIRPVAERLLDKLGAVRETVSVTPYADLHTFAHPPSAAEDALLRAETARFYERFLDVVAKGRNRSRADVALLAEGRVWSGQDAHAQGLVDVLGGYYEAREQLDALPGSTSKLAEARVLIFTPTRKQGPGLPPLPASADALARMGGKLVELAELVLGGERVFAYAATLPDLQ
ncbi:MAG: signal peptide peptidase SppA, type, partial [Myxococcaceae bacterium]|nr:signal peptide peptidase SppA, type [Myxococcaceae bacterium]